MGKYLNDVSPTLRRSIPALIASLFLAACGGGGGGGSSSGDSNGDGTPPADPAPVVFESFDDPLIAQSRWLDLEFRRVPGSLLVEQRLSGESASAASNSALIANPQTVQSIAVPVTVELAEVVDTVDGDGRIRARIGGAWYNDGDAGPGQTGDVFGEVRLNKTGAQDLRADVAVFRCNTADCSGTTTLFFEPGVAAVQIGQIHLLEIGWNGAQFTFSVDGTPRSFTPTTAIVAAKEPIKLVGTRIDGLGSEAEQGHIVARFGTLSVNGVPYDDFTSATLDPSRWLNREFERGITDGALQSRIATHGGAPATNSLRLRDPAGVSAMSADLTIISMTNDGMQPRARVGGFWYDTGLPGPGDTGEVYAEVAAIEAGGLMRFRALVFRCEDANCVAGSVIFEDQDSLGTVTSGTTSPVSVGWDGTQFSFSVGALTVTHQPSGIGTPTGPSQTPLLLIGTTLRGASGSGAVHASFDNVDIVGD